MTKTPAGTHCILELFECPSDLLNDELFVRDALKEASRRSMSTLLEISSHSFQPQGVTAIGLLAESHISIHTWPENGYAAIDVFTCGQSSDPRQACAYLIHRLSAGRHHLLVLSRGGAAPAVQISPNAKRQETVLCRARN